MEPCTWCGAEVEPDDGFRAYVLSAATNTAAGSTGEKRAVFCRLEHLIPWSIQLLRGRATARPDSGWETGRMSEPPSMGEGARTCSHCGAELGEAHVLLVRHRGEHRVGDAFCSIDHMADWAKAGGRWR